MSRRQFLRLTAIWTAASLSLLVAGCDGEEGDDGDDGGGGGGY